MPQRRLIPMDVVLYKDKLWVVSTAHYQDSQCRQLVNLAGYKRQEYLKNILACLCRIVYDEPDRNRVELCEGFYYYPD